MNFFRFLILLGVYVTLNLYLYIRGRQALPGGSLSHGIYTAIYILVSAAIFVAIFAGEKIPTWLARVFEITGGYWMILFIYFVAGAVLGDLLRLGNHYFHFFPAWARDHMATARLLYLIAILIILAGMSLVGYFRFSRPVTVKLNLTTENHPADPREITLVEVSDLHLGDLIRRSRLARWVDTINGLNPDAILIAGDIFDRSYKAVASQHMDRELSRLKARFGVYAIPGNHDYYTGVDKVIAYLKQSGITVLRDSSVVIDHHWILIGRDDRTNRHRKSLSELTENIDSALPRILLDHQPYNLEEAVKNRIDLQLSGHTHDGQVFPFNRIVERIYPLAHGFRVTGKTDFYVSSGLGLWGAPMRIGTRSEIVLIRLKTGNM